MLPGLVLKAFASLLAWALVSLGACRGEPPPAASTLPSLDAWRDADGVLHVVGAGWSPCGPVALILPPPLPGRPAPVDAGGSFRLLDASAPGRQSAGRVSARQRCGDLRAASAVVQVLPRDVPIRWRRSRSLGLPWAGRLVRSVRLPAEGSTFFTWDPVLRRSPNRDWRRHGSDRLVRVLVRVLADLRAAHPFAPRIGVGDLSRPGGGDFGVRYGRPGHVSHQNGLDADLYYPRLDGLERPPAAPRQIDRALAQELVDRFVDAGAARVFVGPRTGLRGPRAVVQVLAHHDNHLHVRLR